MPVAIDPQQASVHQIDYKQFYLVPDFEQWYLENNQEYRECPVSFIEFVTSPMYLGVERDTYGALIAHGQQIVASKKMEVVMLTGIGGGKSFLGQLLMCYQAYHLLCLKDPHAYYKLSKDKPISLVNMGLSATQARQVVFAGFRSLIMGSPWFKKHKHESLAKSITFERNGIDIIRMFCGNSSETTPIGMNIHTALLDEAAFYQDSENRDQAQDIYDTMKARIASRFGEEGMVIVISSPKYEDDFISRKYKEGQEYPDIIYSVSAPTWRLKDRDRMSNEVFVFDHEKFRIVPEDQYDSYELKSGEKVKIELDEKKTMYLKFDDDVLDKSLWIIPHDFLDPFTRNPEKSTRDLGAKAHRSLDVFIKLEHMIDKACRKHNNPVDDDGIWTLPEAPDDAVFVGMDFALNREDDSDKAGFAVGHLIGHDPKHGGMAIVQIDLMEQIAAGPEGEIKFKDIRSRIATLQNDDWEVMWALMDGWESTDTQQILKEWGIETEEISTVKSTAPFESLKESLYAGTVHFPNKKTKHVKVACRELKELEVVKGKKIDHPPKGSKDVIDAVAIVVYKIKEYYGIEDDSQTFLIQT